MVNALIEQVRLAHNGEQRLLFMSHPEFSDTATIAQAGHLTLACGNPAWWASLADQCNHYAPAITKFSHRDGHPMKFRGAEVRRLEYYVTDKDWPIILEAIVRLKLVDISKVFA